MQATHYCSHCLTAKTSADLRQVERDETCLYACRQCGAVEGVGLQSLEAAAFERLTNAFLRLAAAKGTRRRRPN